MTIAMKKAAKKANLKAVAKKPAMKKVMMKKMKMATMKVAPKKAKIEKTPMKKTAIQKTPIKKKAMKKVSVIAMKIEKTPMKKTAIQRTPTEKTAIQKTPIKKKAMKKVSVIAKGKYAKVLVLRGSKLRTLSGLTASDLKISSLGRTVSKKKSAASRKRYKGSGIAKWVKALHDARKALKITGFCAVGGKSKQGQALYKKAKALQQK